MNNCNTCDSLVEGVGHITGVDLRHVPPLTTLVVWTKNSLYRVIVMEGANVYVQGGRWFANPTAACVDGARIGFNLLTLGWIRVGFRMEISAGGKVVVTSPVRAITTERAGIPTVH